MYSTIINVNDLSRHLEGPGQVIVDCRFDLSDTSAGYHSYVDSHIPYAVYADLNNDLSGPPLTDCGRHPLPSPEKMNDLFSAMGISHDTQVIVYDASAGSVASRLWWMLRYMGHDKAAVLEGGWQAWQGNGMPVEPGVRNNAPGNFNGRPNRDRLVTIDEVASLPLLVDSRETSRYKGESEPIDPVAGRIPGAVNYFWKENLDDNGMFLEPEQLRIKIQGVCGEVPPAAATFYCGSGVTACQNILAAVIAGFDWPRLYAGSWSEWCSDKNLPVETG